MKSETKKTMRLAVLWVCMICGGLIALDKIGRALTIEHICSHELRRLQWTDAATRQYRSGMSVLVAEGISGAIAFWCGLAGIIMSRSHRKTAGIDEQSAQPGQPG